MLCGILVLIFCGLFASADGLKCFGCSNMADTEEEAHKSCMNLFVEHNCSPGYQCYYERTATYGKIFVRKGCKSETDCVINPGYCCKTELCNRDMPYNAAQRYSPSVTCDNDVITITINPAQMVGLDLTGIRAGSSTAVKHCQSSQTKQGLIQLTFGITQCETEQTIGPDEVTYKVRINSGSTDLKSTGITRKKIMGLDVHCSYKRKSEDIDAQFIGDVTTVRYTSNSTGSFKYSMGFYEDLLFRSPIHPGTHVTVRQRIYSKIKMQADNDLYMYVKDCYATRTRSAIEVKHWFIRDGCVNGDDTFKQLLVEHDLYEFEFQAFKFRGAVNTVFVVCRAIVCSMDEDEEPCRPPSKSACLPPPVTPKTRVKRSVSNHPRYMVYHGPITFGGSESDEDSSNNSNMMLVGIVTMAVVCTLLVTAAMVFLLSRKWKKSRSTTDESTKKPEM
ncbi:CUB and zona pellucida-like domain-containing protein 1 [Liolophura sinensis]|uniref:CUB and zona pellucida-like domain-containing protein 1 n=1 Tax=Liolophura sinensis TaxID=3198878 RepID=UPI0031580C5C